MRPAERGALDVQPSDQAKIYVKHCAVRARLVDAREAWRRNHVSQVPAPRDGPGRVATAAAMIQPRLLLVPEC